MFKSILILVSPMIILFYFPQNKSNYFGEIFSIKDLNEYNKINNETSDFDKKDVKIEGKILSSCPMKGC